MKFNYLLLVIAFFLFHVSTVRAETLLWTKEITTTLEWGKFATVYGKVGADGSCAFLFATEDAFSDVQNVNWLDRFGSPITDVDLIADSLDRFMGFEYVSNQELILGFNDIIWQAGPTNNGEFLELIQESSDGQFEQKTITLALRHGILESVFLNYPYLLVYSEVGEYLEAENQYRQIHTFEFYDLTNENAVKVVGDAVIGIHGSNLKVRWKTVANAKYKVQSSTDLEIWSDYTEILDGNGSTMVVNIPLDEDSDKIFARVVKL